MSTVWEGIRVSISADGRKRYEDEQRLSRVDRLYTEIRLGALGGALITIAGLVVVKLWGLA